MYRQSSYNCSENSGACIEKDVKSIVILSDRFLEVNSLTDKVRQQLEELKEGVDIVIYGPNIDGLSLFYEKWGLSSFPVFEFKRFISVRSGLISTGSIGRSIVDSDQIGIGFSYWFSPGDEIDITVEDCLEYLIEHEVKEVILLVVRSVMNKQRFKSLLKKSLKKNKPIIYLKVGSKYDMTSNINEDSFLSELKLSPNFIEVKGIKEMISLAWLFDKGYQPTTMSPLVYTWSPSVANYVESVFENYEVNLPDLSNELNHSLKEINANKFFNNPLNISSVIYRDLNLAVEGLKMIVHSKEYECIIIVFPFQMNYHNEVIACAIVELNILEEALFIPILLSQGSHQKLTLEIIKESSIPYFFNEHVAVKSLAYLFQYNERILANTIVEQ